MNIHKYKLVIIKSSTSFNVSIFMFYQITYTRKPPTTTFAKMWFNT